MRNGLTLQRDSTFPCTAGSLPEYGILIAYQLLLPEHLSEIHIVRAYEDRANGPPATVS